MGKLLLALLQLQAVERRLGEVQSRLRIRQNAVAVQQRRIDQIRGDWQAVHDQILAGRKATDGHELDLRQKEEKVSSLRAALNTARTNKEYAAILTQINTLKADNAKIEETALRIMQEVDGLKVQADTIQEQTDREQKKLEEIQKSSAEEIQKLEGMQEKLSGERAEAAKAVPPGELSLFERISSSVDGDAMAPIEIHGTRPPHDYVCGGCFMSLNAEHANALRTRDEIRTCDICGRILYLEPGAEQKARS